MEADQPTVSVQTQVEIFGRSYTIRGEASEELTRQIAAYVDQKMRDVADKAPPDSSPAKIGILVALCIASELFELRHQHETNSALIAKKASSMLSLLDKELAEEYNTLEP